MKAYKLTDQEGKTRNDTQWGENITHEATGTGIELCSNGWIHFYTDPLIAVLMNPAHASFSNPILWECEVAGDVLHEPLKSGCKRLTTIKQIPLPTVTTNQKVAFGIMCAITVYKEKDYLEWALNWLSSELSTDSCNMVFGYIAKISFSSP